LPEISWRKGVGEKNQGKIGFLQTHFYQRGDLVREEKGRARPFITALRKKRGKGVRLVPPGFFQGREGGMGLILLKGEKKKRWWF